LEALANPAEPIRLSRLLKADAAGGSIHHVGLFLSAELAFGVVRGIFETLA